MQSVPALSVKKKPALTRTIEQRRQHRMASASKPTQTGFGNFDQEVLGVSIGALADKVTRYASGVLSPAYWSAFRTAGRALCVPVSELTPKTLKRVCRHVSKGGTLLCDSGAFVYKDSSKPMPWSRVERYYHQIAQAASKDATVSFVLPDQVGCQKGSLDALKAWGTRLIEAVGPKHEVLLPVQRGDMTPSEFIDKAMTLLDRPVHGIAIPCKASAFPAPMLADLANVDRPDVPKRVHFLGISKDRKKLESYAYHLHAAWPTAVATCDAVEHRSLVAQGSRITELRHEILLGPITDAVRSTHDISDGDTEIMALADQAVARKLGIDPDDTETLDAFASTPVWTLEYFRILDERAAKRYGAWATALATYSVIMNKEPRILSSYWATLDAIGRGDYSLESPESTDEI